MMRAALTLAWFVLMLAARLAHAAPAIGLATISEQSGFQTTGRYDEVIRLCGAFQQAYPKQVRCFQFGRTPEGRPMMALAVTRTGALTAPEALKRKVPVVLVQGGIHAGEIDGKDAGFLALREALENRAAPGALDRQVLLFVPVFNVDGHERFGKWNRPNQRGPEAMGWRTTGQNYNLNRDYMKADTAEMQALLALVNAWDPLVYVDLHVTDGAKFQPDVSIQLEPIHIGDDALKSDGVVLRDGVMADLRKQGSDPKPFYIGFKVEDDPSSGFEDFVSEPRYSHGYFQLRNRFGMLVETHSWKEYPVRVRITHNIIVSLLSQVAMHGAEWLQAAHAADARALAGTPVALTFKASEKSHLIDFGGYAYTRTQSDVSGALRTQYDESRPQTWTVPLRDDLVPDLVVNAPAAGYIVPAADAAWVGAKLRAHGVVFKVLTEARGIAQVETFRAGQAKFADESTEGHQMLAVTGAWKAEPRAIGAGALFVPIAQPKARLAMGLLEPQAPDSLLAWGFFNNAFERKEYMEDYVAEDVARDQLAADPALALAFKARLDGDPAFAGNPHARLAFFARRHASWDERLDLYPVMRTAQAL